MELFLGWVLLAAVVGVAANTRGRNGAVWFLLAMVISPVIAGLFVLAMPRRRAASLDGNQAQRSMPGTIRTTALKERSSDAFEAEGVYSGTPYRVTGRGVEAIMPGGRVRFKDMDHFLAAVDGKSHDTQNV